MLQGSALWWNGRHNALKMRRREASRFDPGEGYQRANPRAGDLLCACGTVGRLIWFTMNRLQSAY